MHISHRTSTPLVFYHDLIFLVFQLLSFYTPMEEVAYYHP